MGLFGLFGKKQDSAPKQKRTAAERKALVDARWERKKLRFLDQIERTNPAEYARIMSQACGINQTDQLTQFQEYVEKLRAVGLIKDATDLSDGGSLVREAVAGLVMVLQMNAQSKLAQQPSPGSSNGPTVIEAQPTPASIPPPKPVEPASAPSTASQSYWPSNTQKQDVRPASRWLVSQLEPLTSEQAADWLLKNSTIPQIEQIVEVLIRIPDSQLSSWVEQLGRDNPDLEGLTLWLAGRWPWFVDAVHALRSRVPTGG